MMKTLHVLLLLLIGAYSCCSKSIQTQPSVNLDRQCGKDLSNLWLDVVVVVDNSIGMTHDGLLSVASNIVTVFEDTQIGTNPTEPRTTRVGIVTYNAEAQVNADLNQYQSYDDFADGIYQDLCSVSTSEQSYLSTGLQAAEHMIRTQNMNTTRGHYKKVVIVYASAYKGTGELDPVPVAQRLFEDGAFIITVAYDQGGDEGLLYQLAEIATPGMAYSNTGKGSNELISNIQQSLLQANCYCPDLWEPYRTSFSNRFSFHYGQCLRLFAFQASWDASKRTCKNLMKNKSHLAIEQSQAKHDFILEYVKNHDGMAMPYSYNIGLSWNITQNTWMWEQPDGMSPVPLGDYNNWRAGYPAGQASKSGVLNMQSGTQTFWQNVPTTSGSSANYVCEMYSCDTDNYCDGDN